MKSKIAIILVILLLVFAGIFLLSNQREEPASDSTESRGIVINPRSAEEISELETSNDVFNALDSVLQVLE